MTVQRLARELRDHALERGFDRLGIARVSTLDRDGARLGDWLAAGRDADMGWIARTAALRRDPTLLLPRCRSVVVAAASYWPGQAERETPPGRGRVALYARGRDYHRVLGRELRALAAWLAERSGLPARAFVDTGPVLERAWAERAGIGWIGKNANLLTRDLGSWVLLGEILSAAELEPDLGPHEEFCGSCTACIDACPTEAIVEDGVVDANRCISYWTIERRGAIPREVRTGLGDWMFGCDVCQDVCPWNRFAREVPPERFGRRDDLRGLDPEEILALDETAFRARYSGTALMRAKWEGLRRNACVTLGNRRDPVALPALATALHDADPVIRAHAAWAAGRIGGPAAGQTLRERLARETDPDVRAEIAAALADASEEPDRDAAGTFRR